MIKVELHANTMAELREEIMTVLNPVTLEDFPIEEVLHHFRQRMREKGLAIQFVPFRSELTAYETGEAAAPSLETTKQTEHARKALNGETNLH
jgi:hypothetical protein